MIRLDCTPLEPLRSDEQPVDFENPCPGEVADIKRVADGLQLDHPLVVDDEARGWTRSGGRMTVDFRARRERRLTLFLPLLSVVGLYCVCLLSC